MMVIWDLSCKSASTFLPPYLDDARTKVQARFKPLSNLFTEEEEPPCLYMSYFRAM